MVSKRNDITEDQHGERRNDMVERQLTARDIRDSAVLHAMRSVPRHLFVDEQFRDEAYGDYPLPLTEGQTISQPYVVASMTEHLELDPDARVLEIGTGCGYQAAVLAEVAREVFTIEVIPELYDMANRNLTRLGYRNVYVRLGDGSFGWPEEAPFDGIIVTAAAPKLPQRLVDQLAVGGRMVLPIVTGRLGHQDLVAIRKTDKGIVQETLYGVRFVPMVGDVQS